MNFAISSAACSISDALCIEVLGEFRKIRFIPSIYLILSVMIIEDAMMIANTMNAFHHAHNFLLLSFQPLA